VTARVGRRQGDGEDRADANAAGDTDDAEVVGHYLQTCNPTRHKIHLCESGSLHSTIDVETAQASIPRPNQPLRAQTPNLKVRLEY
jgi:hypothetical protein